MHLSKFNTTRFNQPFNVAVKLQVWNKAIPIKGYDPAFVRQDRCGAWIEWSKYGDTTEGGTGWEIDHIVPKSVGGSDDLSNLQALQWQNNRRKGDAWPVVEAAFCAVRGR